MFWALLGPLCGLGCFPSAALSQATTDSRDIGAASACPAPAQLQSLLGSASDLLRQGRYREAAQLIRGSAAIRCNPQADLMLAAALEGASDDESAVETLRQAHTVWPKNIDLATSLARSYMLRGNTAEAKAAIAHCEPTASTPPRELQLMAMVNLEAQDLLHAEQIGILAYRSNPSRENLLFVANVLQLQGRSQDVVKLLDEHRREYGETAPFLVTIAESEYDATMLAAARTDVQRAVALAPDSYPAHYVLGNVLVKMGDVAGGIREYRRAIEISPRQPRTYYQMGLAQETQGQQADALTAYRQALDADAQYAPAYCAIGRIQLRQNQLPEAINSLNHAREANPAFDQSWYLLIQAYARAGDRDKSRAVQQQWDAFKETHKLRAAGVDREDTLLNSPPQ